jgi:succinyl-CoA synthetase beta subunit
MPLVVRMDGTNAQVGSRLLFDSHLPLIVMKDLDEAVKTVITHVEDLL